MDLEPRKDDLANLAERTSRMRRELGAASLSHESHRALLSLRRHERMLSQLAKQGRLEDATFYDRHSRATWATPWLPVRGQDGSVQTSIRFVHQRFEEALSLGQNQPSHVNNRVEYSFSTSGLSETRTEPKVLALLYRNLVVVEDSRFGRGQSFVNTSQMPLSDLEILAVRDVDSLLGLMIDGLSPGNTQAVQLEQLEPRFRDIC